MSQLFSSGGQSIGALASASGDFWNNIKHNKILIIGNPEKEEKQDMQKMFEEILIKHIPNMGKEIAIQVQEAHRAPYKINLRKNIPRHILIKLIKNKLKQSMKRGGEG